MATFPYGWICESSTKEYEKTSDLLKYQLLKYNYMNKLTIIDVLPELDCSS